MAITNSQSGTNVHEVADGIYRISTPVMIKGAGGFSFNQYLILDDKPLLFHTGPRKLFPHEWLAAAPQSVPLCGTVAAMVSIADLADRAPRPLADSELLPLGKHSVSWIDAPHLPHGWDCGFLMEERTSTLLCGDLFTQGGSGLPPITESDILGPSEAFRHEERQCRRELQLDCHRDCPGTDHCWRVNAWGRAGSSQRIRATSPFSLRSKRSGGRSPSTRFAASVA